MGKTIDTVDHLKNRVLLATYIFRSLPTEYLQKTRKEAKERQKIRNTIVYLKRDKFLAQKKALHGADFLHLTRKGYIYVIKTLLKGQDEQTLYAYKAAPSLRKSISEHNFMNFMFVWQYIVTHPEYITKAIKIYDDSNINDCKIRTFWSGKDVVVSPDLLIYTPAESSVFQKALCIENDTGRETYRMIYQKLIEYAVLIETGMSSNKISDFTIYFIIPTKKRIQQLFYNTTGILQLFSSFNNTKQIKDVRARTIMQAFASPKVHIYISAFDQQNLSNPYTFEKYNLIELLLIEKPTWNIYL